MALTVRDVLYLYSVAREAYERFRFICGNVEQARNAVALLVWLDQGTVSAIHHVPGLDRNAVNVVAAEANNILGCLREEKPNLPDIPLISVLCNDEERYINPRFFAFNQDLVVRGVTEFLDGVGKLIFDDRLNLLLRRSETGLIGNPSELTATYSCIPLSVPEDCRSMFITFSHGLPIDREEIFKYFTENWGNNCVVRVLIEKTSRGMPPKYGRIIFSTETLVSLVLNGERLVKITIGNRQIWLRKYVPRPGNV